MADIYAPHFMDADKARAYLEKMRWPDGPVCPHCGVIGAHYALKGATTRGGLWKCKDCRKQFSVTVGTVFERSKIALNKWLLAVHLMCSSKKAMSSHQIHRMLGVTYKSAWFMTHRIREAMKPDLVRPKTQIGSVEGYFASVATHYGHPAIVMRERKTGRDIKCLISEDDSKRIADEIRIDDVWHNARIVAHGRISYADNGAVSRVEAHTIRRVNSAGVELQLDREFTSGMSSFDYLEAFREGALG